MAERDQLAGAFGRHDPGDLGDRGAITSPFLPRARQSQRKRRGRASAPGRSPPPRAPSLVCPKRRPSARGRRRRYGWPELSCSWRRSPSPAAGASARPCCRACGGCRAAASDHLVPTVAHGAVGTRQAEDEHTRRSGRRRRATATSTDRPSAVADQVEHHREAVDHLVEQGPDRFGRHVAARQAGAAGGDDGVWTSPGIDPVQRLLARIVWQHDRPSPRRARPVRGPPRPVTRSARTWSPEVSLSSSRVSEMVITAKRTYGTCGCRRCPALAGEAAWGRQARSSRRLLFSELDAGSGVPAGEIVIGRARSARSSARRPDHRAPSSRSGARGFSDSPSGKSAGLEARRGGGRRSGQRRRR